MSYWIFGFAVFWVACGVIGFGGSLAFLQREFSPIARDCFEKDLGISLVISACGPMGVLVLIVNGGFKHGLMYRNPHEPKKWSPSTPPPEKGK